MTREPYGKRLLQNERVMAACVKKECGERKPTSAGAFQIPVGVGFCTLFLEGGRFAAAAPFDASG